MHISADIAYFFRTFLPFALMPPAGLLWVVIFGFAIAQIWKRLGYRIAFTGVALLYLLSTPAVSGFLLSGLEESAPVRSDMPPPGAIIVLGGDGDRPADASSKA